MAGLSAATLASLAVGIALGGGAVGLGMFVFHLDDDLVYLIAAAFVTAGFAVGFVKPLNMKTWEAAPFLYRSYLGNRNVVPYKSSLFLAMQAQMQQQEQSARKLKKDRSKEDARLQEEYLDARDGRGISSPEWLLPRYAGWQPGELPPA